MTDISLAQLDGKLERLEHIDGEFERNAGDVCEVMRKYAVRKITMQKAVDTGALRDSVGSKSGDVILSSRGVVVIGIETPMEYAKYIEFGTGTKGSAEYGGHTSPGVTFSPKSTWFQRNPRYQSHVGTGDAEGRDRQWIQRFAQHPRPFMRPALYDNIEVIKEMLLGQIQEVYEG